MSPYACSLCRFWAINCIFWPIETLKYTARNGRLDASLLSRCAKLVGFIKFHQVCEDQP